MVVSPYAYKWLKGVHKKYENRTDFAGVSLNGGDQALAHNTNTEFNVSNVAFMYICVGTWGFSPNPYFWAEFQDWFHFLLNRNKIPKFSPPDSCYDGWCPKIYNTNKHNKTRRINANFTKKFDLEPNYEVTGQANNTAEYFKPYVFGAKPTYWYQSFEKNGLTDTMWEMWFIYYSVLKKRYTVYSNINAGLSSTNKLNQALHSHIANDLHYYFDAKLCLGINMNEPGLHFGSSSFATNCFLLKEWYIELDNLPEVLKKFNWEGQLVEKV